MAGINILVVVQSPLSNKSETLNLWTTGKYQRKQDEYRLIRCWGCCILWNGRVLDHSNSHNTEVANELHSGNQYFSSCPEPSSRYAKTFKPLDNWKIPQLQQFSPPPPLQWPTALNPPLTDSGISILQTTMTIGGALGLIIFFWCSATNAQALNPVLRATPTLLLLMIFCFLKANWIPERWYSVKLLRLTLSCLVNVVWLKQQHNGQED